METSRPHLDRLLARDHAGISEKGRTAVRVHGHGRPRAFVLLHGMSSSPAQFDKFATELFSRGHNVLVPRLPRHGHADRLSSALGALRPDELYAAMDEYVAAARELGDRVTFAGFSLGGLMTACVAQRYQIERCVAIAPFLGVAFVPGAIMPLVSETLLRLPNRFAWWNPFLRERQMPEHGYPRFTTHAIGHASRMARVLLLDSKSRGPAANRVLLITNARESSVHNATIVRLYERWHARHPEKVEMSTLKGLPPSHDIVEPRSRVDLAARVFPDLLAAIDPD